jgi:tetratricopeptide (TPR) repeat protein
MKNFLFSILVVSMISSYATAQEYKKQLKNVNKSLGVYFLDPTSSKDVLMTAIKDLDAVMTAEDAKADPMSWISKGQIYNEIAKAEMIKKVSDPNFDLPTPNAGIIAFEAFKKAMELPAKKSPIKDIVDGLIENENLTNNIGITHFQKSEYDKAFTNFKVALDASDIIIANKGESRLKDVVALKDQIFYTGVCGYYGSDKKQAVPYFTKLYDMGDAQPLVYEALFTITAESNESAAMKILDAGRKAHPDDNGILFAEINYYLKINKLDVLVDKLKTAIAKEPNNVSVYTTLGNVYDQLNQKERAAGNAAKADEYFNEAMTYFDSALKVNPKTFDAIYSKGQLYYNKAAAMTDKLNELSNDYSSAGTKKYNAYKAEMDGYFESALPFFIQAEELDPTDTNTMIALKEIYARNGKLDKSQEYKAKLEKAGKL